MHPHYSFGTADLVALMSAHRTAMQRGAKSDALQREITRVTLELDPPLDQPRHSGKTLLGSRLKAASLLRNSAGLE